MAAYYEIDYHADQTLIYKLRQETFSTQYADKYTTELTDLCLVFTCFDQSLAGLPSMYGSGSLFEPGSHDENAEAIEVARRHRRRKANCTAGKRA